MTNDTVWKDIRECVVSTLFILSCVVYKSTYLEVIIIVDAAWAGPRKLRSSNRYLHFHTVIPAKFRLAVQIRELLNS